jgi:hypothetical protein
VLWSIYASALAVVSAVTLTVLRLDPMGLVPGLGALSLQARRWVWFTVAFVVCLGAQVVWWATRGQRKP